jgi:hypothetical protein
MNQYVRLTDDWIRIIDLGLNAYKTVIMSRTHMQQLHLSAYWHATNDN